MGNRRWTFQEKESGRNSKTLTRKWKTRSTENLVLFYALCAYFSPMLLKSTHFQTIPLLPVSLFIYLLYYETKKLLNETRVTINEINVIIYKGPFQLTRYRVVPRKDIKKLYIKDGCCLVLETEKEVIGVEKGIASQDLIALKNWMRLSLFGSDEKMKAVLSEFEGLNRIIKEGDELPLFHTDEELAREDFVIREKIPPKRLVKLIPVTIAAGVVIVGITSHLFEGVDASIVLFITSPLWIYGLWYFYTSIAGSINRSSFMFTENKLTVKRGPLLMFFCGLKEIESKTIRQVYVEDYVVKKLSRKYDGTTVYKVMVRTTEGEVALETGISDIEDALALERWLEKRLNIKDENTPSQVKQKNLYR